MGIFSNIVESIKDTVSYFTDASINIMGNISDLITHTEQQISRPTSYETADYWYDDMYDDYRDWIDMGIDS